MTSSPKHYKLSKRRSVSRSGHTLLELLISMSIMTILMSAMTTVIVVAGHAIPDSQAPTTKKIKAMELVDQMGSEIFYATSITEASANSITFTVADRGHGAAGPETIRYAWSGTLGDPLTRQYNVGTVITMIDDVQLLNLSFEKRLEPLTTFPRVLMFVANEGSLVAQETTRKNIMESWGFTVQPISDNSTQDAFDTAIANNDVLYIPDELNSTNVLAIVTNPSIGIVNEDTAFYNALGFTNKGNWAAASNLIVQINSHEITSVFSLGSIQIFLTSDVMAVTTQTVSTGTQVLGIPEGYTYSSLLVIDTGGEMISGAMARARRVCLPWSGFNGFDFNNVATAGLTIMRRAIVWAAAPTVYTGAQIDLQLNGVSETARSQVQILNRPTGTGL